MKGQKDFEAGAPNWLVVRERGLRICLTCAVRLIASAAVNVFPSPVAITTIALLGDPTESIFVNRVDCGFLIELPSAIRSHRYGLRKRSA